VWFGDEVANESGVHRFAKDNRFDCGVNFCVKDSTMTIGWTKFSFVACLVTGLLTASAWAQGDPVKAFDPSTAAVRRPGTTVRIDLIGDSTQTDHAGYGRGFCANLTEKVDCVNMARGGASTRSFRAQGLWERSLQTKPDYMLIQFGHNDVVFNRPAGAGAGTGAANTRRLTGAIARWRMRATTRRICGSTLPRRGRRGSSRCW
jgi:GDSL-like Lipase/Acylhydrolase family